MKADLPPAALRLDLDRHALAENWRVLDRLSGNAEAGAAVKADAYGLGAAQVVPVLLAAGCRRFFVAHPAEALPLLTMVPADRISVLHGPLTAEDARFIRSIGVKPVINSLRQARLWSEARGGVCDVMVDTGINRLGLPLQDLGDPALAGLDVDILMSHLASADEDSDLNEAQRARWIAACDGMRHRAASLANSAGIVLGEAFHGQVTRPGLSLYGGIPRAELAGKIRQVAKPSAAIMQVRNLRAGEGAGYNATFVAPRDMRVGVIALGYADGYLRCWSGKGAMLHDGNSLPVIGRVSMDMTIVDLTDAPSVDEGDWLEVGYDLPTASAVSGLSQYELLTLLADRFAR